jgi:hypothetical protein
MRLNLSPPKDITFIVAVAIAGLTLLGRVVALPVFSQYGFGLLVIAFIILAAGVLLRDL